MKMLEWMEWTVVSHSRFSYLFGALQYLFSANAITGEMRKKLRKEKKQAAKKQQQQQQTTQQHQQQQQQQQKATKDHDPEEPQREPLDPYALVKVSF